MKKLDWYIIRKFLGTYFFSIALIISISIVFDFSENVDEFIEKNAPTEAIIFDYYLNFIPYFANLFSPLFIFVSVIFFTSKLASNTEIISILASGVSFNRILRPYIISALFLSLVSFYLNNFMIPHANKKRLDFRYTYIKSKFNNKEKNMHFQLQPNSYGYLESYSTNNDIGLKFSLEQFDSTSKNLKYKLLADYIKWDTSKNLWTIQNYYERWFRADGTESIKSGLFKDTVLNLSPADFVWRSTDVEMLDYFALEEEIKTAKFKGSKLVTYYEIEKHKRVASPFSAIILTLIGVAISSRKVRGGIGMHLGLGLLLSFSYIMFMKITQTFSTNGGLHPMIAMWVPNILYGILAIYMLKKAPK